MKLIYYYVESMLLFALCTIPVYFLLRNMYMKKNQIERNLWHELLLFIFVVYHIGLASQTIVPKYISDLQLPYWNNSQINLIPFQTLDNYFSLRDVAGYRSISFINLLGNIFLFTPLGFLTPILWKRFQSTSYILLLGFLVTLCIESIQLFIGRSTDVDDMILNILGVLVGFFIYRMMRSMIIYLNK